MVTTTVRTEHPHIVRSPGVVGGTPTIAGTRISVAFVVGQIRAGDTPQDILASYPHLTPAALYDAISFYYDHQDEIDRFIDEQTLDAHAERYGFTIDDGRLRFNLR
jgi:uncharacterized protein (DUF433 family)